MVRRSFLLRIAAVAMLHPALRWIAPEPTLASFGDYVVARDDRICTIICDAIVQNQPFAAHLRKLAKRRGVTAAQGQAIVDSIRIE